MPIWPAGLAFPCEAFATTKPQTTRPNPSCWLSFGSPSGACPKSIATTATLPAASMPLRSVGALWLKCYAPASRGWSETERPGQRRPMIRCFLWYIPSRVKRRSGSAALPSGLGTPCSTLPKRTTLPPATFPSPFVPSTRGSPGTHSPPRTLDRPLSHQSRLHPSSAKATQPTCCILIHSLDHSGK